MYLFTYVAADIYIEKRKDICKQKFYGILIVME